MSVVRSGSQVEALRIALQTLGDLCGLGLTYFDFDGKGYVRTATEVSSDNAALMRNIARHEHVLEQSIAGISRALLHIARGMVADRASEEVDDDPLSDGEDGSQDEVEDDGREPDA